jgi:hypothetical protein
VRRFAYLAVTLGLVLAAATAEAVDKRAYAGTLARAATPARPARIAELAKDASPPKAGGIKRPGDYRRVSAVAPRIVFERVR